jgi:predicted  nucleic acid-binding Zn-ribbon protein
VRSTKVLEQLELLLQLQDIDIELLELEAAREALPGEIDALEEEKGRLRNDVGTREGALEEVRRARSRKEHELEDANARINDLRAKQLLIKTNAEYAALTHEIEFMKQEISDIEESVLELLEDAERSTSGIEEARARAAEAERESDRRLEELRAKLGELDEAIEIKRDERLRVSKRVEASLLKRYDRLFASKGDCAIAHVTDGACSGCYKSLPPQTILEVKRARGFIECDGCGRILYWSLEGDGG